MENLRGFEYRFNVAKSKIKILDLRFSKIVTINHDYTFSIEHDVIHFLESKNISIDFKVCDENILLSRNFENQIK